jgi:hypothetical protein
MSDRGEKAISVDVSWRVGWSLPAFSSSLYTFELWSSTQVTALRLTKRYRYLFGMAGCWLMSSDNDNGLCT